MPVVPWTILLASVLASGPMPDVARHLPAPDDSRHGMLRAAMLGLLPAFASVTPMRAGQQCLELPAGLPYVRLVGPHGDSLIGARCQVVEYRALDRAAPARWAAARYRWTSLFTAEDATRGPAARDTVSEEEVVLFEALGPRQVRPVWHTRFETGPYAIWRSVEPEIEPGSDGTVLLGVTSCVNGTGGCGQEFLRRHADGRWAPVWQAWLDQLPRGFAARIRHGARIDPRTLRGEAGLYSEGDANCCPSHRLVVQLEMRGDSLVLGRHAVVEEPDR